jgi:ABC-type oligopeptide transport system ATPase subunit
VAEMKADSSVPVIECRNLKKYFQTKNSLIKAVDGISLSINSGECYGLVGESGCGKTTLSSLLCALSTPDSGQIFFNGKPLLISEKSISQNLPSASDKLKLCLNKKELKDFRRSCQIVFQDPYSSLNPKLKVKDIIEESLIIHKTGRDRQERLRLVNEIRTLTGLPVDALEKYPSELSGGQRQRVSIASAVILNPQFVIFDESVSSLDVLIQNQILNLLKSMQKSLNLTSLFISHNLNVVGYMADRIGVMYKGKIVEEKPAEELLKKPEHPYTKNLLKAAGLFND